MQIVSYIRDVAQKKGYANANRLGLALKVPPDVAARLWRGDFQRIDRKTLQRVCEVLKVQPGSVLKYEAEQ